MGPHNLLSGAALVRVPRHPMSSTSQVTGCNASDLSGGFLRLGGAFWAGAFSNSSEAWDAFAVVEDNVAHGMASEYEVGGGACGGRVC